MGILEYTRLKEIDFKKNINNRVFVIFLARDVSVRFQKDKTTRFITFNMVDKDCLVDCKIFGATQDQIDSVIDGRTFNAAVDVKPYEKAPAGFSCIIYNIELSQVPPEYFADWAEDLPGSQKIIENALGELADTLYGQIVYPILVKHWTKFYTWSAAKSQHHNKLGDLITHTAEVVKLVDDVSDFFNNKYGEGFINIHLLLAAAILHDIGKVNELDVDTRSGNTNYSTSAALSTHIMDVLSEVDIQSYKLGLGVQEFKINEINEEEGIKSDEQLKEEAEVVNLLRHCLSAHHGKLAWGSPIEPSVPEAYILHIMDNMSAEMFRYNRAFKDLAPGKSISSWGGDGLKTVYKESNK